MKKANINKDLHKFQDLTDEDKSLVLKHFEDIQEYESTIEIIAEYQNMVEKEKESIKLDSSIELNLQVAFAKKHKSKRLYRKIILNPYFAISTAAALFLLFLTLLPNKSENLQNKLNISSYKSLNKKENLVKINPKQIANQKHIEFEEATKQPNKSTEHNNLDNRKAISRKLLKLKNPSICTACIKMDQKAIKKLTEIEMPGMNENAGSIRMIM